MTLLLLGSAAWLATLAFVCCLARAAARGDASLLECLSLDALLSEWADDGAPEVRPCPSCGGEGRLTRSAHGSARGQREDAEDTLLRALGY